MLGVLYIKSEKYIRDIFSNCGIDIVKNKLIKNHTVDILDIIYTMKFIPIKFIKNPEIIDKKDIQFDKFLHNLDNYSFYLE